MSLIKSFVEKQNKIGFKNTAKLALRLSCAIAKEKIDVINPLKFSMLRQTLRMFPERIAFCPFPFKLLEIEAGGVQTCAAGFPRMLVMSVTGG